MHDHLLAITAEGRADRFHQTAALVLAVAGRMVDVLRIETERAMVALPAAADRRTDKGFAVPALEFFQFSLSQRRCVVDALLPSTG